MMSMQTVAMKGEKYFLALSQVFFKPVLVVASPFRFAFLTPKIKSTTMATSIAAIHSETMKANRYRCSTAKV